MTRRLAVPTALVFLWSALAVPTMAQEEVVILVIGKWIANQVAGYFIGKAIDTVAGNDYDKKLQAVEVRIQSQLRQANSDKALLNRELETARAQRQTLAYLLQSKPDRKELMALNSRMQGGMAELRKRIERQEIRLNEHDGRLSAQDSRLKDQDGRLSDHELRIKKLEDAAQVPDRSSAQPPARDFHREGSYDRLPAPRSEAPRRRSGPSHELNGRGGVTLDLWVSGSDNEIRIEESASDAQSGTFTISDVGSRLRFRLLSGTGAVIHVTGDDNRLYIPSEVLGRVRVVRTGRNNSILPTPTDL